MRFSDRSLPSQAVPSCEVEEHERSSRPSQDVFQGYKLSELGSERQSPHQMPMPSHQIFNLMKDRLNDRKTSKDDTEYTTRRTKVNSPSELREPCDRISFRSGDMSQYVTEDVEVTSKSSRDSTGYTRDSVQRSYYNPSSPSDLQFSRSYRSQAGGVDQSERRNSYSQNMTEYTSPGVSVGTGHSWPVYDRAALSQPQQPYQPRATDADEFGEVRWLDSWTTGSEDVDLRNYRGHY